MNPKDAALRLLNAGKKKLAQPGIPRFVLMFVLAFGVQAALAAGEFYPSHQHAGKGTRHHLCGCRRLCHHRPVVAVRFGFYEEERLA